MKIVGIKNGFWLICTDSIKSFYTVNQSEIHKSLKMFVSSQPHYDFWLVDSLKKFTLNAYQFFFKEKNACQLNT